METEQTSQVQSQVQSQAQAAIQPQIVQQSQNLAPPVAQKKDTVSRLKSILAQPQKELAQGSEDGVVSESGESDNISPALGPASPRKEAEPGKEAQISAKDSQASPPMDPPAKDGHPKPQSKRVKAKFQNQDIELDLLTDGIDPETIPQSLLMTTEYQQKMTEVEKAKAELERKEAEIEQYLSEAARMLAFEENELSQDQLQRLREEDPEAYIEYFERLNTKKQRFSDFKKRTQANMSEKQRKAIESEIQRYAQVIPEWLDEGRKTQDIQSMNAYLKEVGFAESELAQVYDSRLMKVFRDAALYQQAKQNPVSQQKQKPAPAKTQPSVSASAKEEIHTSDEVAALRQRLKKTGSQKDAVAVLRHMLRNNA